jgi:hypothetical protein
MLQWIAYEVVCTAHSKGDAPEPLVRRSHKAGKMALDVLNIVEFGRKRVLNVNDEDLPIGLALIKKRHDPEDLNLLDLADVADLLADFTDVKRIVVALCLRLGMLGHGVLPGLASGKCVNTWIVRGARSASTHLGERAIVPNVTVVRKAVADEAQTALFYVLFDGVEGLFFAYFHLGVGPAGHLDDHVEDAIVLVGEEGDVVEGRDDATVVFGVYAMLWIELDDGQRAKTGGVTYRACLGRR